MPRLILALLLLAAPSFAQSPGFVQSPVGAAIPGRYLVTYRSGAVPTDAAARAASAGATLLRRHDLLGIAVVQADNPESLTRDPAVQSIVQDRIVQAHSLTVGTAPPATSADSLYNSPAG